MHPVWGPSEDEYIPLFYETINVIAGCDTVKSGENGGRRFLTILRYVVNQKITV